MCAREGLLGGAEEQPHARRLRQRPHGLADGSFEQVAQLASRRRRSRARQHAARLHRRARVVDNALPPPRNRPRGSRPERGALSLRVERFDARTARVTDRSCCGTRRAARSTRAAAGPRARDVPLRDATLVAWRDRQVSGVLPLALVTAPITGGARVRCRSACTAASWRRTSRACTRSTSTRCCSPRHRQPLLETRYLGQGPTNTNPCPLRDYGASCRPARTTCCYDPAQGRAEVRKGIDRHGCLLSASSLQGLIASTDQQAQPRLAVFAPSYFQPCSTLRPRAMLHASRRATTCGGGALAAERHRVLPYYSARRTAWTGRANHAMYACHGGAVRRGVKTFDFGRSRGGSGAANSRPKGFEPRRSTTSSISRAAARRPRSIRATRAWRCRGACCRRCRLVARGLGHSIMRHVP